MTRSRMEPKVSAYAVPPYPAHPLKWSPHRASRFEFLACTPRTTYSHFAQPVVTRRSLKPSDPRTQMNYAFVSGSFCRLPVVVGALLAPALFAQTAPARAGATDAKQEEPVSLSVFEV